MKDPCCSSQPTEEYCEYCEWVSMDVKGSPQDNIGPFNNAAYDGAPYQL